MGSMLDANSDSMRKRIANHTFDDEEGEEYGGSAFGGFGDYMRRKKIKLQNLDAQIRSSASGPPIFRGVVAHVNGYTQPSLQDLHRMIVSHGGGFLQYLDGKTAATHIIASALTPKKREEFKRYRIVKPAWVVESIEAGRMLPWDSFRVVDEGHAQKVLRFDNGRILSQTNCPPSSYRDQSDYSLYPTPRKESQSADKDRQGPLEPGSQSDYGDFPSFTSIDETSTVIPQDKPKIVSPDNETTRNPRSSSPSPKAVVTHSPSQAKSPAKTLTSEEYNAQLLSDPRMRNSSVVNPEFLQQFYRESRLHHLSTWKAELKAQLQAATLEKSQSQAGKKRVSGARRYIMHVDFDCFFAAVSTLKHPELEGKPVAVAHGTGSGSEIASCNYAARAHGVKNGMWMKGALQACPDLKVVPYDFPAYEDASQKFYSAILSLDGVVQSVSIDEALVDITMQCLEAGGSDGRGVSEGSIYREQAKADEIAQALRDSVKHKTGCAVSVGIGGNILQAKVALRKAKPAGQFQLKPDAVLDFIGNLTVQGLPSVGHSLNAKLEELGVKLVKDVRDLSRDRLTSTLGPKTGAKLWDYARGIDRTEVGVEVLRKSVSAEVNWGIRFVNQNQAEDFVKSLCEELHRRLVENLVKGKQLTLKVMRRSADAPLEPVKHLGHGKCDVFNKSVILGVATNAAEILGKEAVSMLRGLAISPGDLRGLGVQMTKLEPLKATASIEASQRQLNFKASPTKPIKSPIQPPAKPTPIRTPDPDDIESPHKEPHTAITNHLNDSSQKPLNITGTQFLLPSQPDPAVIAELPNDIRTRLTSQAKPRPAPNPATLPPQSQLDPETLAALPEDVRAEVLAYYTQPQPQSEAQPGTESRSPPGTLRLKKPTTPTKRKRGRPSTKASGSLRLTQSNFLQRPHSRPTTPTTTPTTTTNTNEEEISNFLAALPEDIRLEILQNKHLHSQPQPRHPTTQRNPVQRNPVQNEKRIHLPAPPEKPTFTSNKLTSISDLRDAVGAWHAAFMDEGPFDEDVESLAVYVRRVVVEERDVDKAVSVVRWLGWLVDDSNSFDLGLSLDHHHHHHHHHNHHNQGSGDGIDDGDEIDDGDGGGMGMSQSITSWDKALLCVKESVLRGLEERGLPPVEF
ncbi:hypothetical protein BDV25DRAFT_96185 [Aspergillus avenaceus]|uniref:DNA repair protein REV1 n=1 Tax=Aspergillus avenaceus TaxID=36643 RepID=A0A5N6TDD1_ASPAV|nr:hypothetical protein BDV25DRAFT_96185 [Aspergillus avenaceus]